MATKLEKDLTRESTVKVDDRELLITITADQKIAMKPKGLKGDNGLVEIGIDTLYESLAPVGEGSDGIKPTKGINKTYSDDLKISIGELRTQLMIADIPFEQKVTFSNFVRKVINEMK